MIEGAEAETVTPELLRSLFRETNERIEEVRKEAAADAAARHLDVVRSQHTIIDQLEKLETKVDAHDVRFDRVDERFDRLEAKVDAHDVRFDRLEAKVDAHDVRFDRLEAKVDGHDVRFDRLEAKVDAHDVRFDHLDRLEGRFDRLENKVDRLDAKVDRYDVRFAEIEDGQREVLDSQQQLLRQQSYADGRVDAVERRLGGEWADDSTSGFMRAEMTVARGQLRAVHSSVGTLAVRVEDRMNSLHADVRAIAVAVGARPAVAAKEGGG